MPHDLKAARKGEGSHKRSNDDVRPTGPAAEHTDGGKEDRNVADRVVARADPDRSHIGVAAAEAIQHEGNGAVGYERKEAYRAHECGLRERAMVGVESRCRYHPCPKRE